MTGINNGETIMIRLWVLNNIFGQLSQGDKITDPTRSRVGGEGVTSTLLETSQCPPENKSVTTSGSTLGCPEAESQ